jgi:hypothetical protein
MLYLPKINFGLDTKPNISIKVIEKYLVLIPARYGKKLLNTNTWIYNVQNCIIVYSNSYELPTYIEVPISLPICLNIKPTSYKW